MHEAIEGKWWSHCQRHGYLKSHGCTRPAEASGRAIATDMRQVAEPEPHPWYINADKGKTSFLQYHWKAAWMNQAGEGKWRSHCQRHGHLKGHGSTRPAEASGRAIARASIYQCIERKKTACCTNIEKAHGWTRPVKTNGGAIARDMIT